jgi:small subunit ribosomal protein S6
MTPSREYETVYVLKPDIEGISAKIAEKVTRAIERQKGTLLGFDEWGKKKLAYDIQKTNRGVIVQVGYCGGGDLVNEVERELRLDDQVIRHFTIKLADAVDADKRQKEYATTKRARREAPEEDERDGDRDGYRGFRDDRDDMGMDEDEG